MRSSNLICVLVPFLASCRAFLFVAGCGAFLFMAGCGTPGALYLPDGQTEQVQRVSIEQETFQPETEQQQIQNEKNQPKEEQDE
jgi:hypothetical protein